MPDREVIYAETGVFIPSPPSEPLTFWVDKVCELRQHRFLLNAQKDLTALLERQQTKDAVEFLEQASLDARRLGREARRTRSMESLFQSVADRYRRIKSGERGVPLPWDTINEATYGMWPEDIIGFLARPGTGKCLDESTLLHDPRTGAPCTLKEVIEDPRLSHVWSWDKEGGIHTREITAKVDTGRKRCLTFTLRTGREVVVTPEHPFLTAEGWKRADEVEAGSTVAICARVPEPLDPRAMPPEDVDLLGILLANGSYTGNHVSMSTADPEMLRIAGLCAQAKGVTFKHTANYDYTFAVRRGQANPVRNLLRRLGIDGCKSKDKQIPDEVYRLPNDQLARFLGVFWMGDGYVEQGSPGLTLASEHMVRQIQHLLLRFGIQSSVNYKEATYRDLTFDAWRLRVFNMHSESFYAQIPLWGEKKASLEESLGTSRNSNVDFPSIGKDFRKRVREVVEAGRSAGIQTNEIGRRLGRMSHFGFRDLFSQDGKRLRSSFKTFTQVYGVEEEFAWLWDSDLFWDCVETIEDAGERKIYDLTVEPTSCFVANDIVVHNTWVLSLIALHAQLQGKRVLFATTEMSDEEIALRYWSLREKWSFDRLWRAQLKPDEEKRFFELAESGLDFSACPFDVVSGDFDITPASIMGAIEDTKPDLLVLDGAYLLKAFGRTRNERHAEAFEEIKRIAKRAHIPIVIASQLNRDAEKEKGKTRLGQVAFSDALPQIASYLFFIEDTEDDDRKLVIPAKTRHVQIPPFEIRWRFEGMDFSEAVRITDNPGDDRYFVEADDVSLPF